MKQEEKDKVKEREMNLKLQAAHLDGENKILKQILEQKLEIVLIPKLKWETTP